MNAGPCKVVSARVDALTLAYRVALHPDVVAYLKERQAVAREHGRARVRVRGLWGELRFSRADGAWNVANSLFRVRLELRAPGAVARAIRYYAEDETETPVIVNGKVRAQLPIKVEPQEPGWTLEVVWSAQALADMDHVGVAVNESRRLAESLAREVLSADGEVAPGVFEQRVRRFDLAADVAGWAVDAEDATRIVRPPRAKQTRHGRDGKDHDEAEIRAGCTLHEAQDITGISVAPGGAVMCRLYNKRVELAEDVSPAGRDRVAREEARWTAGGWDGEAPVTRVEFQIRGVALKELGLRDPLCAVEPSTGHKVGRLEDAIDRVWKRCLRWCRLVVRDATRASRCSSDPRWTLLDGVTFYRRAAVPHGRRRVRGGASAQQTLGCVLSMLASAGTLAERCELVSAAPEKAVEEAVRGEVRQAFGEAAELVAAGLLSRWGPREAKAHLAIVGNAVRERFLVA